MAERKLIIRLGQHTINIIFPRVRKNFRFFLSQLRYNAKKEYQILQILSGKVNVPKVYDLFFLENTAMIIREYIPGVYFFEFIKTATQEEILSTIRSLIEQLHYIETQGIFLPEFSSVSKNVIISNGKPYIIDVERGRFSKRPIVTKFLTFLLNLAKDPKLGKILKRIINIAKIPEISRRYKEIRDLKLIYEIFTENSGKS